MPKNNDDIINGTKYHKSIDKGDEVTSLIFRQHRGIKSKVIGYSPFHEGYFKTLLVKTDTGYSFYIKQKYLCYWEDFPKLKR